MKEVNQLTHVSELEKGDEILAPSASSFRRFRLMKDPKRNPKHSNFWSAIKCEELEVSLGGSLNPKRVVYMDLSYKQLWLLKINNKYERD